MTYPIPRELLDDRLAWVGTSGYGKTYNASAGIEHVLARKHRVVISDPLDVWWGLRLASDGKTPSPFDVVIFGGKHADLPVTRHAGAIIGETVATMRESCIVSLGTLGGARERRLFMLDFLEALYHHTNPDKVEPYHVVFDEADLWAPQKPIEDEHKRLGARMEEIVRRGRVRGFIPWLITQRPAVLSKDVLSQADGLVSFKLTSSQDRDALGAWVEGQADRDDWKKMRAELATLERGTGVVWIPGAGILKTAAFPPKATYDSSKTPKRGERREKRELQPLDVDALKGRLSTVDAEAKANDPKALKAEIGKLKAEIGKLSAAKAQPANAPAPDNASLERERQDGYRLGFGIGMERALRATQEMMRMPMADMLSASQRADGALKKLENDLQSAAPPSVPENGKPAPRSASVRSTGIPTASSQVNHVPANGLSGPAQRILDAMRELEAMGSPSPPREIVSFLAGYSNFRSKGFANAIGELRSAEMVTYPSTGLIALTDAGRRAGRKPEGRMTTHEIRRRVVEMLGGASARILDPLIGSYPASIAREDLAKIAGYENFRSKGFANAIGRLRTLGFIAYPSTGQVVATELLFP